MLTAEIPTLTTAAVAALLDMRPDSLKKMRLRGDGPEFTRIGRRVRYRREDVEEWVGRPLCPPDAPEAAQHDGGSLSDDLASDIAGDHDGGVL